MSDKKTEVEEKDEAKVRAALARAEALSPERRSDIGKKGAAARWGTKPRATHKGNFRKDFGIDVDCYVLNDEQKTAVISQRGMAAALGRAASGSSLPRFVQGQKIAPYVGIELAEKLSNPLIFQWSTLGSSQPPALINGYDVTILFDLCVAVLAAEAAGELGPRHANLVKQARIIQNAAGKAGLRGLVYALAGYDQTKQEVIEAFKFYVREEAREYEKEFPDQLYKEWYRLYEITPPARNKPWKFMHLTIDQVYHPLARSNGKVLALTRAQRAASGERTKKLHQFLSEIGVKALRTHLGRLLGIAEVSDNKAQYEQRVEKIFGAQLALDLNGPSEP